MSKEKVEVNGEKCFEMKGEIKGSDIVGMMESGMADSLGSEIDEDVIKDLELPCTIAVIEDDISFRQRFLSICRILWKRRWKKKALMFRHARSK